MNTKNIAGNIIILFLYTLIICPAAFSMDAAADPDDTTYAGKKIRKTKVIQVLPKPFDGVLNQNIKSASMPLNKSSLAGTEIELKWDNSETIGYCDWASWNDSACVTFDSIIGGKLDSIKVALCDAGSIEGSIWSLSTTGNSPIDHRLSGTFIATSNTMTVYPFPVPFQNWATVDLRSYSISTDHPFGVVFVFGSNPAIPGIMVSEYPGTTSYHNFTYLQNPYAGYPGWYYMTLTTSTIALYLIHAYVSINISQPILSSPINNAVNISLNPVLSWNSIPEAISYNLQVSNDPLFNGYLVNFSGISNTSYQLNSLTKSNTYYWRVNANNSSGTSNWSETWNFTTINLSIPVLTYPSINEVNVSLNPALSWNNISDAISYNLQVSNDPSFASFFVNVSGITNTSYQLNNLSNETVYYWRVSANYSNGTSDWSDVRKFTTEAAQVQLPVVQTKYATNIGVSSSTLNGLVNPNGLSTTIQFEYGKTTSYGNSITASQSPVNGNVNVDVYASLSGLTSNTLYHYRIKADNNAGTNYGSDFSFLTLFNYPGSIPLSKAYSFSDPSKSSSYMLIGLPGSTNIAVTQFITGKVKEEWNAYYDNGETSNYLIEYDGSSIFQFKPGNGFWVISKSMLNISQNVSTVALNSDNSYNLQLHNGWNIISNPFEKAVVWDSVIKANSLPANSLIYSWNSIWSTPSVFNTYEGYYFYNQQNLQYLKIFYNPSDIAGKEIAKSLSSNKDNNNYLRLSLEAGNSEKSFIIISIDSASSKGFDEMDILSPPGDFEEAKISIFNNSLNNSYKRLIKETRPKIGEGEDFNIKVKNLLKEKLILTAERNGEINNYEIYLLDKQYHRFFNLKKENNIFIKPSSNEKDYQIIIGSMKYIAQKENDNFPNYYTLSQNYPNPFNPATTIEYAVPIKGIVTIKVYDIMGREVKTLLNKEITPGYYQIEFNAKGFPSGIYFYRMQAGNFIDTKKILLLK